MVARAPTVRRLGAFAVAVALAFGAGAALGTAVGPIDPAPAPSHASTGDAEHAPSAPTAPAHGEGRR